MATRICTWPFPQLRSTTVLPVPINFFDGTFSNTLVGIEPFRHNFGDGWLYFLLTWSRSKVATPPTTTGAEWHCLMMRVQGTSVEFSGTVTFTRSNVTASTSIQRLGVARPFLVPTGGPLGIVAITTLGPFGGSSTIPMIVSFNFSSFGGGVPFTILAGPTQFASPPRHGIIRPRTGQGVGVVPGPYWVQMGGCWGAVACAPHTLQFYKFSATGWPLVTPPHTTTPTPLKPPIRSTPPVFASTNPEWRGSQTGPSTFVLAGFTSALTSHTGVAVVVTLATPHNPFAGTALTGIAFVSERNTPTWSVFDTWSSSGTPRSWHFRKITASGLSLSIGPVRAMTAAPCTPPGGAVSVLSTETAMFWTILTGSQFYLWQGTSGGALSGLIGRRLAVHHEEATQNWDYLLYWLGAATFGDTQISVYVYEPSEAQLPCCPIAPGAHGWALGEANSNVSGWAVHAVS